MQSALVMLILRHSLQCIKLQITALTYVVWSYHTLCACAGPSGGESCTREDPRDLDDGDDDDDDDDLIDELDEDDREFFSRVEGAVDRLRAYALQSSAEIEVSCADGFRCSNRSTCVPITGAYIL